MREAKQDPLTLVRRFPGTLSYMLHVKDMSAPPKNQMVDVGKGVIDWREFLAVEEAGVRHVFVEHDDPKSPMAFLDNSIRYLKALRFPARA